MEKEIFGKLCNFWNTDLAEDFVNQIFDPWAFFFFLLTGATWYYYAIYVVFTYFASYTGYENDICEVISNLHVQGWKFGGKFEKCGGKSFSKSELGLLLWSYY